MTIRAGGRVALTAATGLLVCVVGVSWTSASNAAGSNSEYASTSKAMVTTIQLAEADQLNEVDKTLQEAAPPSQTTVAVAPTRPAAVAAKPAPSETSTWDQTSLIGKIFIAFGALLTIASAARMFMA
ncbi:MAG: hypothetical protein GY844_05415 [Bradyrhizobium sp.]|nr:hypothetical protein [Bradyrhizobium sp.]